MAIDYSTVIYAQAQNQFGRAVVVTPLVSQPGQPAYNGRGIYTTTDENVLTEDSAIFSDQITILDIMASEYPVLPMRGDQVLIPASGAIPAAGLFEILDTDDNGGGEITLSIRKVVTAKPAS